MIRVYVPSTNDTQDKDVIYVRRVVEELGLGFIISIVVLAFSIRKEERNG